LALGSSCSSFVTEERVALLRDKGTEAGVVYGRQYAQLHEELTLSERYAASPICHRSANFFPLMTLSAADFV